MNTGHLGVVFKSLGQCDTAKEYFQKALAITTEIGDRKGEASCYRNLAYLHESLGQYDKAKEYLQKALAIGTEIGVRKEEASCYGILGTVFTSLGQYDKAKEYLQKALVIETEIGKRKEEASCYGMLGTVFTSEQTVRARLVVLGCCHSGSGQIRAEGIIGIARAFLGSGARSVLVALWAIPDSATEKLMSRFYEHLVEGESASESLHQAMKWMRKNGFTQVSQWASFTLIGDGVRFEFGAPR